MCGPSSPTGWTLIQKRYDGSVDFNRVKIMNFFSGLLNSFLKHIHGKVLKYLFLRIGLSIKEALDSNLKSCQPLVRGLGQAVLAKGGLETSSFTKWPHKVKIYNIKSHINI